MVLPVPGPGFWAACGLVLVKGNPNGPKFGGTDSLGSVWDQFGSGPEPAPNRLRNGSPARGPEARVSNLKYHVSSLRLSGRNVAGHRPKAATTHTLFTVHIFWGITLCYGLVLPGRKSGFRAGFRSDSSPVGGWVGVWGGESLLRPVEGRPEGRF
jgi:hypothetical protein